MKLPPCVRDCPDRKTGCHGSCEKYLKFRRERMAIIAKKNKERDTREYINEHHRRDVIKTQHYLRQNGKL